MIPTISLPRVSLHAVLDAPFHYNYNRRRRIGRKQRVHVHNSSSARHEAPPAAPCLGNQFEDVDLDTLLNKVSQHASSVHYGQTTVFTGTGKQFGLNVDWSLRIRATDGAFREEITSPWLSFTTGFDGINQQGTCSSWDVDTQGIPHALHLDDHEVTVLVAWLRTGAWATPVLRPKLSILPSETFQTGNTVRLTVRLKAFGSVYATMTIDKHTARTIEMDVHLCGDRETWEFGEWRALEHSSGLLLSHPTRFEHSPIDGAPQLLEVAHVDLSPVADLVENTALLERALYKMPPVPLVPQDTTFIENVPAAVPAWRTRSGHLVVKATVLGVNEEAGDRNSDRYFILDTGASGFVIEPRAADELGLLTFGEVYITGMAGKLVGKFRKGKAFRLGPLELKDPVMMEMSCSGLVQGGPGPVVGIVGFDVFRRAIVDIPAAPSNSAKSRPADVTSVAAAMALSIMPKTENKALDSEVCIYIYHPEDEDAVQIHDGKTSLNWIPVTMLSSLPHVEVHLSSATEAAQRQPYLMMIDTGAGGMDMMINASAAQALDLVSPQMAENGGSSQRSIRGVGGSAANPVVFNNSVLECVRIGEREFSNVACLIASPGAGGGVELSHASAGIVCGGLLKRARIVMDLSRNRMAILD